MSLSDYLKLSDESYLDIQLNEEQQITYDKVTNTDESIFLTGSPGTEKSLDKKNNWLFQK